FARLASARTLEEMLPAYESLLVEVNRYDALLTLQYATDTTNTAARDASRALDARFTAAEERLRRSIAATRDAKDDPALRPYAYFLRTTRDLTPKPASCDTASREDWQSDLRDLVKTNRDVVAFALLHLAKARNDAARARGFPDAVTEAYAKSGWTRAQVDALLEKIASYGPFQPLPVERGKVSSPQLTIEEASTLLLDVLRPLGPKYTTELAKLLDPASRRLDILPGPHRRRGGFSLGFVGMDSVFYTAGFTGTYNDLRVLTHESTHAMQRQLESKRGVRPVYADGPKYLFEATAIFNELLLPDALAKRANDPQLRAFYLEQFLTGKGIAIVFIAAAEAALEQAVYDGVARGELHGADDLDALTLRVMGRFVPPVATKWMDINLMYEDPFYDINYMWAGLVALNAFAKYERDPAATARGYVALLENGFDRPPDALLRDFLGIDVYAPSFVDDAIAAAQTRIDELKKLR
ncbi:MAG TPA: M3 family metallopeptidase, partial [Thermoanaerobaculia bacterium]|nr:M3 family metallopeptidase [Thermoanaerobaculia bacterium]